MIEPKTCDGDQIDGPPSYSDRAGGCDRDRGGRRGATGDGGRRSVVAACGASGIGTSDAGVLAGVAVAVTGTAPAMNPVVAGRRDKFTFSWCCRSVRSGTSKNRSGG